MVRLTDRPDMTLNVYRGRKKTMQQQCNNNNAAAYEILVEPKHHLFEILIFKLRCSRLTRSTVKLWCNTTSVDMLQG